MKIIKRSGTEVEFDISKIVAAVAKANKEVVEKDRLTREQINEIAKKVTLTCSSMNRTAGVEEIQDTILQGYDRDFSQHTLLYLCEPVCFFHWTIDEKTVC